MNTTDNQSTPVRRFTATEMVDVIAARNLLSDFERFLLDRFAAYTRFTEVYDTKDRRVDPIEDPFARTSAGYGHWRLGRNWLDTMMQGGDTETAGVVPVEHYLSEDRGGGGSVTAKVEVPVGFVFGDYEQERDFAEYLRLKAIFEPNS